MYRLAYDQRVEKDLHRIPKSQRRLLLQRIELLPTEPRRPQVEKLTGLEGYRLRVGDYRVLLTIDDARKLVTIYRILHRREAYR